MSELHSLLKIDSQMAFMDWGLNAQLEEVHQVYGPETGRVEEQVYRSAIRVICQDEQPEPVKTASATLGLIQRTFLVRQSELPRGILLTSARLQVENRRFQIQAVCENPGNGILLLHCVSDGLTDGN